MDPKRTKHIVEACLLVAARPMSVAQLEALFEGDDERPTRDALREAIAELRDDYAERAIELVEVASGWRLQSRAEVQRWVSRLFQERTPRYSRALLETLVLVAYRQPITRGEIEEVRGVAVSSTIVRTLQERQWIREVGHKDVPGRPALLGTTKQFLDYFNLKRLEDLPTLGELKDLDAFDAVLANTGLVEGAVDGPAANDGGEGGSASGNASAVGPDEGGPTDRNASDGGGERTSEDVVDGRDRAPDDTEADDDIDVDPDVDPAGTSFDDPMGKASAERIDPTEVDVLLDGPPPPLADGSVPFDAERYRETDEPREDEPSAPTEGPSPTHRDPSSGDPSSPAPPAGDPSTVDPSTDATSSASSDGNAASDDTDEASGYEDPQSALRRVIDRFAADHRRDLEGVGAPGGGARSAGTHEPAGPRNRSVPAEPPDRDDRVP